MFVVASEIMFCTGPPASRCDMSIMDIPVPPKLQNSICALNIISSGRHAGPAEKLPTARVVPSFDAGRVAIGTAGGTMMKR